MYFGRLQCPLIIQLISFFLFEVVHLILFVFPRISDFLRHAPCLHQVRDEYEDCLGKYHNVMAKITSTDQPTKRDEFGDRRNSTAEAVDTIKELCW